MANGDDGELNIEVTADGEDLVRGLTRAVRGYREELAQLFAVANSDDAKAARKQAADELAASARTLADARRQVREATRIAREQTRDEEAASARQLSADRKTARDLERRDEAQRRDELASSARQISADRKAAAERDRELRRQEREAERKAVDDAREARRLAREAERAEERTARAQRVAEARQRLADIRANNAQERAARRQQLDELRASERQIRADRQRAREEERRQERADAAARRIATDEARRLAREQAAASRALQQAQSQQAQQSRASAQAADAQAAAFQRLGRQLLAIAAAFAGFQGFRTFVREGLEFNRIIETANLGIASLITAQTKMVDSSGRTVEGIEKLQVAQALATTQIDKLRIAGLQTAATTEQLSVAFQQAVGVGLRWGLTLDQIRTITIQVSQAALGLGVPLNQLNEEIRSLLTGTITPRNTRIATALGITNEMIRNAQQAGTLFDVVTKKLEAFTIAGAETQKTFVGVFANLKEALQNLAGDATRPLFDELKQTGIAVLTDIFDMKHARITTKFSGILDVAKNVFGDLGRLLADGIEAGLEGAEELSRWLTATRMELTGIYQASKDIGSEVASILKDVVDLLIPLGAAATETGLIKLTLQSVGLILAEIHSLFQVIVLVMGQIGTLIISALVLPIVGFEKIVGRLVLLFNEKLGSAILEVADAGQNMVEGLQKGVNDYAKSLSSGGLAIDAFVRKLADGQDAAMRTAAAQERLNDALRASTTTEDNQIADLDAQLAKGTIKQKEYAAEVNKVRIDSVQRQLKIQRQYFDALDVQDDRERRRTLSVINELKKREAALKKSVTLTSSAEPAEQKDSMTKRVQGENLLIKQLLSERLRDLKVMLDNQELSYQLYFDEVTDAQQLALDRQIAAQQKLLASTTDQGAREKILDQIEAFEREKLQVAEDNNAARLKAEQDLQEQFTQVHVQLLRDQGRLSDARALEIGDKYRKLIRQLKAEGRPEDVKVVERLFEIDTAKVRLDEIQKRVQEVQQSLSTRIAAINAEQEAGALNERQAREAIVKAYRDARAQLVALIPEMERMAALTGDPSAIDNVEQLKNKLAEMGTTIRRLGDDWLRFRTALKESGQDAIVSTIMEAPSVVFQSSNEIEALREHLSSARRELERLEAGPQSVEVQDRISTVRQEIEKTNIELENAKDQIKDWKDLFLDAARSIVSALQRVAAEMLATLIIQKLIGFAAGFSGGGAVGTHSGGPPADGRVAVATGGLIRGPGTSTSDSIPAWLSDGEYVVRASAVRSVGTDLLDQINSQGALSARGRSRARGYADGGLVQASGGASGGFDATVGLEAGLVVRHLQSKEGTKAVMTIIGANRKAVQAIVNGAG